MRIRHQVELPSVEEAKGLMQRIRENRWTPVVIMSVITLAAVKAVNKDTTITINNYVREVEN